MLSAREAVERRRPWAAKKKSLGELGSVVRHCGGFRAQMTVGRGEGHPGPRRRSEAAATADLALLRGAASREEAGSIVERLRAEARGLWNVDKDEFLRPFNALANMFVDWVPAGLLGLRQLRVDRADFAFGAGPLWVMTVFSKETEFQRSLLHAWDRLDPAN